MVYICIMTQERSHIKSEQTRQLIIEKVAPLFNKKGFAGTSMSDLTRATGLTKGAIYGHFRNKDEIAVEAFKYNLSLIVQAFHSDLICTESAKDRLLIFIDVYRKIYPRIMANGGCPVLNNAVDSDDTHKQLKALSINALSNSKKILTNILKDGIGNGEFRSDFRPDAIAGIMLSLLEGSMMFSKLTADKSYFNEALAHIELIIKEIIRKEN